MTPKLAWLSRLLGVVLMLHPPAQAAPETHGRRVLEPFDYRGVSLGAGSLRRQVDEVRAFYLSIPDDDLLKGFRTRAGRPAPGKELGGWYSSDTFLVFGQIISGLWPVCTRRPATPRADRRPIA